MSQCCGKESVESLIDKFKVVNATFNQKQHPHTAPAFTTQKSNPFLNSYQLNNTNTNTTTKNGFVKYIRTKPNTLI